MKIKSTPLKFGYCEPPTIDMSTIDDDEETNEEIPSEISTWDGRYYLNVSYFST